MLLVAASLLAQWLLFSKINELVCWAYRISRNKLNARQKLHVVWTPALSPVSLLSCPGDACPLRPGMPMELTWHLVHTSSWATAMWKHESLPVSLINLILQQMDPRNMTLEQTEGGSLDWQGRCLFTLVDWIIWWCRHNMMHRQGKALLAGFSMMC